MRAVQRDAPGGDCTRRCRHGGRHDSELNTVTGSCSYEPNSTKALKSIVSYIAPLRMTRAGAVYGDAGPSAGSGTRLSTCAGGGKKERAPRAFRARGVSRKRHVLTCRGGESERLDGVPAGHRRSGCA